MLDSFVLKVLWIFQEHHSRYGEQNGASVGCSCVGVDGVWEEMYTTVVLLETVSCYHTYQTLLSAHTETLPTIT